jgi:hypothetical protein
VFEEKYTQRINCKFTLVIGHYPVNLKTPLGSGSRIGRGAHFPGHKNAPVLLSKSPQTGKTHVLGLWF